MGMVAEQMRSRLEAAFAPTWLVNILDATTPEEALAGFIEGSVESRCIGDTEEEIHLHLGFLWLNYRRGKQTLLGTLLSAGKFTDTCRGGIAPDCEEFYLLANEIDGGGPINNGPHQHTLEERVEQLFAPFVPATLRVCNNIGIPIHQQAGPNAGITIPPSQNL